MGHAMNLLSVGSANFDCQETERERWWTLLEKCAFDEVRCLHARLRHRTYR